MDSLNRITSVANFIPFLTAAPSIASEAPETVITLRTYVTHRPVPGILGVELVVFFRHQVPRQLPGAAFSASSVQRWSFVAAGALYVVFLPNNHVPHFASFFGADLSGPARFHKTLSAERIRQEMNLRCGSNGREFRITNDLENEFRMR